MKITKFLNIDIEPAPLEMKLDVEMRCREIMASNEIDDIKKVTLLSASSVEKDIKVGPKTNKMSISKIVAEKLAKKALDKNINIIYFDRGKFKYHGRVKEFAETLRKNGMDF